MKDDITPPGERRKPKVILPIERPEQVSVRELAAKETAEQDSQVAAAQVIVDSAYAAGVVEEQNTVDQAIETIQLDEPEAPAPVIATERKTKFERLLQKLHLSWPLTRKQQVIGGSSAVVMMFIVGFTFAHFAHTTKPVAAETKPKVVQKVAPKPTTVASTLSGLQVDPSVNQRPIVAAMIENSTDARPQSGLDQAGVVFEALAEGGITRFLAVFQDQQPDYLGPVRSARPYYVQWANGFDAAYAHVGGSPDALANIKAWGIRDMDQFYNSSAYQRISSRAAPHNVYSNVATLSQLAVSKGYTSSNYAGWSRKADAPSATPNASSIDFTFSGPLFNSHFDYDKASNSYKRSEGGAPHMVVNAAGAQTQLSPKVVIAINVPTSQSEKTAQGSYYAGYNPLGSGQAWIFQDGIVTIGTWNKADNKSPVTFSDANGQPIKLDAGQTWIGALAGSSPTYH